jgi:hypothetical protein
MSSFPNFTEKWDREVKPFAKLVAEECKTDPWVAQYVNAMIWDIDHDLREERLPIYRLFPCVRKLNNAFYYIDVHKLTDPEEVEKLKELGRLLEELQDAARKK